MTPKRKFSLDERGSAYAWLMILISITLITLVWVTMTEPIYNVMGTFENRMPDDNTISTFTFLKTVWNGWPVVLIIFLIVYGVMQSTKKEYDTALG